MISKLVSFRVVRPTFYHQIQIAFLANVILGTLLCFTVTANEPETNQKTNVATTDPLNFAIVIHGGAGSSPGQFSAEKNAARRESLKAALAKGVEVLKKGGSSLDAVESVIRTMENDPIFNAGKGAVFNAQGKFELDASIMNGFDRSCGAVAGVTTVKNPISLARMVMTNTKHVMLSAKGADKFAIEMNVERVDNSYFQTEASKARWERQQKRKGSKISLPNAKLISSDNPVQAKALKANSQPSYLGTVGCVALDSKGNIAAGTSTGGLSNKKFGRVGDSPVIGAGTYADNQSCGVSCTGIGEEFIRNAVAYDVSARMRYKKIGVQQATKEVIHQVLKKDQGGLIALDRNGKISIEYNTKGMSSAAADSSGKFEINWGDEK